MQSTRSAVSTGLPRVRSSSSLFELIAYALQISLEDCSVPGEAGVHVLTLLLVHMLSLTIFYKQPNCSQSERV